MFRFTLAIIVSLVPLAALRAHEMPDGLVDRSIQVIVFPDRIEVHYLLGMNDRTIGTILKELDPDQSVPVDLRQAVARLRDVAIPRIPGKFTVTIDGVAVKTKLRRSELVERHHVRMELIYTAPLQADTLTRQVKVADQNFFDRPGYHRMAIKGREGTRVFAATVPPILARVPMKLWGSLSQEERSVANQCEAQFATPVIPSKTHKDGIGR